LCINYIGIVEQECPPVVVEPAGTYILVINSSMIFVSDGTSWELVNGLTYPVYFLDEVNHKLYKVSQCGPPSAQLVDCRDIDYIVDSCNCILYKCLGNGCIEVCCELGCQLQDGSCYSDYLYWDVSGWAVGSQKVHLGCNAGETRQGLFSIALGNQAGNTDQSDNAIAIGNQAGYTGQGYASVAIGYRSGYTDQSFNGIAIGQYAGFSGQGDYSIAIGAQSGVNNQYPNSIIVNATGNLLDVNNASGLYIAPIRNIVQNNYLYYNTSSKEVTYFDGIQNSAYLNAYLNNNPSMDISNNQNVETGICWSRIDSNLFQSAVPSENIFYEYTGSIPKRFLITLQIQIIDSTITPHNCVFGIKINNTVSKSQSLQLVSVPILIHLDYLTMLQPGDTVSGFGFIPNLFSSTNPPNYPITIGEYVMPNVPFSLENTGGCYLIVSQLN
jgi:hypothetical protein